MPLPVHLAPKGATSKAVKTTFNLKLIPGINPTNIRRTFEIFECESYLPKDLSAFKVFGEPFNEILVVPVMHPHSVTVMHKAHSSRPS